MFAAALPPALSTAFERDRATLHEMLERMRQAAIAAWPGSAGDGASFLAYVAQRLPEGAALDASLGMIRTDDLLLAFACVHGEGSALRAFQSLHFERMRRAARRVGPETLVDDVVQRVMTRLLLSDDGNPPALAKYSGRGSLAAWLEVSAGREMKNALRSELPPAKRVGGDEAIDLLEAALDVVGDADLSHLKESYRQQFRRAFELAFETLDPRERTFLRHEHIDGLDGSQIAALYGVHKATISRWRQVARDKLLSGTRRALEREFGIAPRELESMMRIIQSQLHVSITRLLQKAPDDAG